MQIKDLSQPKHSKILNENLARQFGYKLNVDSFTTEQLKAAKAKLAEKLNTFQRTANYNEVYENSQYQKDRALMDVLNQALSEKKLTPGEEKKKEKYVKGMKSDGKVPKEFQKRYGKRAKDVMYATATKMAKTESIDEAMQVLKSALNERVLTEGAEENAALIMSSRDMVDKVTGWLDDVASIKAERLLELVDSIRDELGSQTSGAFSDKVKPALEEIYDCLERNRQILTQAVAILTGEEAPTMGAEGAPEPAPGEVPPETGDSFGASAPAAGGTEPMGRMKRESLERSKKKV
jgi:hypothetical protein